MKKFDLIKLINEKPYLKNNLEKDMHGIFVEERGDFLAVLFFNPKNVGDYAVIDIKRNDVVVEKEALPNEVKLELDSKLQKIMPNAKNSFEPMFIHAYDIVELVVEDEKYSRFGIHKGDRGCVMDDDSVQNYVEVDFSGIDDNGEYYGDCISVDIDDLRLVSTEK